jgi:hypothetical protein
MTWNKKNDQFALSCGLRPSSSLMLRWALRRAKLNEVSEIEIDLRVFNAWIAKNRGTAFDRKTIREAIAQLDEKTQGLILISKSYTPWVKKIIVRPLAFVLQEKSSNEGEFPKLTTGNPMFSNDHKQRLLEQQQQDIDTIESLFNKLGMKWSRDALLKIWRMSGKSVDDVKTAIECMLHSNTTQTEPIRDAHRWFIRCMEIGWYRLFHHQLNYELPRFNNRLELAAYINCHLNSSSPPDIRGSDPLPNAI